MELSRFASTALAQAATRMLYPYGSLAVVRRGPLKNYRIVVSPSMGLSFIWNRQYQEWAWTREISAGSCVYDVGANFGQSTLRLAHAVGRDGHVVAFEPMPATFRTLCRNIRINNLDQVTPIEAAVGARDGAAQFVSDGRMPAQGHFVATGGTSAGQPFPVRQICLDSYRDFGWRKPQLLKIDVEGGAGQVLAGANQLLKTDRPAIYIELHNQAEHDAVGDLKDRYGYTIHDMTGQIIAAPRTAYGCGPLTCRAT